MSDILFILSTYLPFSSINFAYLFLCLFVYIYIYIFIGHYISYCLLNSNSTTTPTTPSTRKWIMFSDDNYRHVSEKDVLKAQATMLFYDKL